MLFKIEYLKPLKEWANINVLLQNIGNTWLKYSRAFSVQQWMFRSTIMHIYVQRDNMMLLLQVLICLKQFLISSRLHLSRSACQPGPPGPLIPVGAADRNANNGRWLEGARTSASHMKRHIYYQEMAFTLRRLDKPVPLCH